MHKSVTTVSQFGIFTLKPKGFDLLLEPASSGLYKKIGADVDFMFHLWKSLLGISSLVNVIMGNTFSPYASYTANG